MKDERQAMLDSITRTLGAPVVFAEPARGPQRWIPVGGTATLNADPRSGYREEAGKLIRITKHEEPDMGYPVYEAVCDSTLTRIGPKCDGEKRMRVKAGKPFIVFDYELVGATR